MCISTKKEKKRTDKRERKKKNFKFAVALRHLDINSVRLFNKPASSKQVSSSVFGENENFFDNGTLFLVKKSLIQINFVAERREMR